MSDPSQCAKVLEGAEVLLNAGPAGRSDGAPRRLDVVKTLKIAVDLNAVPPLGIEGIDVNDAGQKREGVMVYGAFGVGNFKTKLHKACVAKLFTRNDLVMDAEAIADVARTLTEKKKS